MISKHIIIDHDVDGTEFGITVLAQGAKGKSQKIFHILDSYVYDPEWYLDKYIVQRDDATRNLKGLVSETVQHIGNFPGQKEDPMKVFTLFPEYFL